MTSRPFAYNTGEIIPNTTQLGDLAIAEEGYPLSTSVDWWMGPDEDLKYIICSPRPDGLQPTPVDGVTAYVGFFGSNKTDEDFIRITSRIAKQSFTSVGDCTTWLTTQGYWTSKPTGTGGVGTLTIGDTFVVA